MNTWKFRNLSLASLLATMAMTLASFGMSPNSASAFTSSITQVAWSTSGPAKVANMSGTYRRTLSSERRVETVRLVALDASGRSVSSAMGTLDRTHKTWRAALGDFRAVSFRPEFYVTTTAGLKVYAGQRLAWGARLPALAVAADSDPDAQPLPESGDLGFRALYPNPTAGSLTVRFVLPRPGWATLALLDVQGREVARVREGEFAAGETTVNWDGRGKDGRRLSTGAYLMTLRTGSGVASTRVLLNP